MAMKRRQPFNSTSFLAKVGEGRSIGKYRKGQVVFSQGDAGDAVFYVQKGKVKITVVSEQGSRRQKDVRYRTHRGRIGEPLKRRDGPLTRAEDRPRSPGHPGNKTSS
jgi:hypothetical protein